VAKPYTERVLVVTQAAVWMYWTVPSGYRAVIRTLIERNESAAAATFSAAAGPGMVWYDTIPASSSRAVDMRAVAYAGETIGGYKPIATTGLVITAYVFAEDQARLQLEDAVAGDPPDDFLAISGRNRPVAV
jgi:hypothetical protein